MGGGWGVGDGRSVGRCAAFVAALTRLWWCVAAVVRPRGSRGVVISARSRLRRSRAALILLVFALVGFLEVFGGLFQRALGVVLGAESLLVFVAGALALLGDVEDLA